MAKDIHPISYSMRKSGRVQKVKQEVRITKYGADFVVRKNINTSTGQASVIATDLVKAIGDGIIGYKSSAKGKGYSGFAVRSQPDDFPRGVRAQSA